MYYVSKKVIFTSIIMLLISACTSNSLNIQSHKVSPKTNVKQRLFNQHSEWKSVKYQLGGLSKSGIDCSGFVYRTFTDKFNIKLPRTTKQQALMGTSISDQTKLQVGDLVFFKTGIYQRHVGIYLENKKFLHVSTSKGVTISRLDNPYWKSKYWKSTRVLSPR